MLFELLTARYPGMRQWLMQRLSASTMAMYVMLLVVRALVLAPANYAEWVAFFTPVWWRLITLLFFVCMLLHAWIGVRDVLRDYIPHLKVRTVLQVLVDVTLLADLCWIVCILTELPGQ